jgi:hypothetical protein
MKNRRLLVLVFTALAVAPATAGACIVPEDQQPGSMALYVACLQDERADDERRNREAVSRIEAEMKSLRHRIESLESDRLYRQIERKR